MKVTEKSPGIVLVNGNPVPVEVSKVLTAKEIKNKMFNILSEEVFDEELGKKISKGEKILRNLIHNATDLKDKTAITELLDRTMGKPLQQNINLNQEISYSDFLKMLKSDEGSSEGNIDGSN